MPTASNSGWRRCAVYCRYPEAVIMPGSAGQRAVAGRLMKNCLSGSRQVIKLPEACMEFAKSQRISIENTNAAKTGFTG
jgi:hypothetical protein